MKQHAWTFEGVKLSEVSRQRKTKFYDPMYLCNLQALEPQTQRTDLWFQGQGWGGVGKWLKVVKEGKKDSIFPELILCTRL